MLNPRRAKTSLFFTVILVSALLLPTLQGDIRAQQSAKTTPDERERGISLYQQGNDKDAIEALRQFVKQHKDDVSAWHYLGLALNRQGKTSDARKAHEKAAKNGEQLLTSLFAVKPESDFPILVSKLKPQLDEAADSADKYLELSSKPSGKKVEEWHDRADFLRDFTQLADSQTGSAAPTVFKPGEVTVKARILSRPEPEYTEEARKHQVTGTVVLRAVISADGRVRAVRPIKALPYGLTIRAIRAARQIKFIPATRDGIPVSQYIQIEYNFNLY